MNKYFLLSAAAALASTTASAGTVYGSFTFASSGGTPSCDGATVYTSGASVSVWSVIFTNCSNADSFGQGLAGKKTVNVSDNALAIDYGIFSEYMSITLPRKLKTGKPWEMWIGIGGTTSFLGASGIIIANDPAKPRTGESIKAGLKELIQAHRAKG